MPSPLPCLAASQSLRLRSMCCLAPLPPIDAVARFAGFYSFPELEQQLPGLEPVLDAAGFGVVGVINLGLASGAPRPQSA